MLVDYLEKSSEELRMLEEKIQKLDEEYRKCFDKEIRQEMDGIKKEVRHKKTEVYEQLMKNIQEIYLLKKYYPALLDVFLEDTQIGMILRRKKWLFDFKILTATNKDLAEVKNKRKELSDARDFLKKWVGKIDSKSLVATWSMLKGKIKGENEKDEVLTIIQNEEDALKKRGWLIILHEPYIIKPLKKIMKKIKKTSEDVTQKSMDVEKSKGNGTVAEYNATKALREAQKKKKMVEKKCKHLLYANPEFLMKIKTETRWDKMKVDIFTNNFIKKIDYTPIKEELWLREMKKKIA
ncbi:MAG: hypothetical protein Q7S22_02420 [Candidatus Micrarchaeota archaeon]|nr:hypothetical protein [Candidatus Micrarchaeota archaeon]